MKQFIKLLLACSFSILLASCSDDTKIEENKENELIGNIQNYNIAEARQLDNDVEVDIIKLKTNNGSLKKEDLYIQKIYYEYPNIIKITINNILVNEEKSNIYSDIDVQINQKLEILYNDIKLVENNEKKKDIYGELIIKNSNLENYEKNYLKYYSQQHPEKIEYNDKIIKIKFNKTLDLSKS